MKLLDPKGFTTVIAFLKQLEGEDGTTVSTFDGKEWTGTVECVNEGLVFLHPKGSNGSVRLIPVTSICSVGGILLK